ncbi:MAG TPA: UvrD-helicase domain-containing protein [Bryobacteraceae bacterium]|jgi:ATP-dependent exoDNAse (exonuclease V) beta subunit
MSTMFPAALPQDAGTRRRALDARTSFIVQAPAGSGKTELLIQRLLTLLAQVDEPEEIVSITFTRKAASEMRERLIAALQAASLGSDPVPSAHARLTRELAAAVLERDRQTDWRLLEHPARLRIETIDALASGFTRAMPWLSRFGAMPEPVEDPYPLYAAAASRTLRALGENGPESQAIRHLLVHLDNDVARASSLIAQMLGRREQWLPLVVGVADVSALRPVLEGNLAAAVESELAVLRELAPAAFHEFMPRMLRSKRTPRDREEWREASALLIVTAGTWRKKSPPQAKAFDRTFQTLIGTLNRDSCEPFRVALRRALDLPEPKYNDAQWAILESVFRILKLAAANVKAVFQSRGQVDFVEIALAALQALGPSAAEPTDLALAVGHKVRHLLVDEFQDTSEIQHELLMRLTGAWESGEQTLFTVGDPMQSIYRFRHAEVGLFLAAREHGLGGAVALEPLELTTNFRAQPQIVDWVNRTFEAVFPQEESASVGAVRYTASDAFRAAEGEAVTLRVLAEQDDAAEAAMIGSLVEQSRAADPNGKVAILVRARPHLKEITAEFDRRGWRYRAVQVTTLAESAVVRDLLALTRALVHLADRPAWLAILRAPWCGLSLADLHAIAGADHTSTIWTLIESPSLQLSCDGATRLLRFKAALIPVLKARRRMALRPWVEAAWIRLGGPACLASDAEREDAAAYLDLLEEFEEGGDISEFDRLDARLSELYTKPDPEADERLQVMTIHQAKGLEFDTVILPGLGKPPKREENKLLLWSNFGDRVLLAPVPAASNRRGEDDPIYKFLERHERTKDAHESRRLLYVAATRARERLHLIGHAKQSKDGPKPVKGSLLEHLWPLITPDLIVPVEGREAAFPAMRPNLRLPSDWSATAGARDVPWRREERSTADEPEVTFEWVGNTLRHAGVVVHRFIQRIAKEGLARWDRARVEASKPEIAAALESLGTPPADVKSAADRVVDAVAGMLEDRMGRWTLEAHRDARSELELTAAFESRTVRVAIDRTFVDDDGVRWIIDYKTSAHEGADVEAFLDNEIERYRGQLEVYARVMRMSEPATTPIRTGLYFPLLRAWRIVVT